MTTLGDLSIFLEGVTEPVAVNSIEELHALADGFECEWQAAMRDLATATRTIERLKRQVA